jgi:hypothetical protein
VHPTEHRGYRELAALGRGLSTHWAGLAERLAGLPPAEPLRQGATAGGDMLAELAPALAEHDLYVAPAAEGMGRAIGLSRAAVRDRFLERDRALRFAAGEIAHVVTLLGYLAGAARARGDEPLAELDTRWEHRFGEIESALRATVVELGTRPDEGVERADPSPLGLAAQSLGQVAGSVGEWVDRRAGRRG